MSAKLDEPRRIKITADAQDDIAALGLAVWQAIKPELIAIAGLRYVTDHPDVCRVAQCDGKAYRLKMRKERVRVAFELTCGGLVVFAVLERNGKTYDLIETRFYGDEEAA